MRLRPGFFNHLNLADDLARLMENIELVQRRQVDELNRRRVEERVRVGQVVYKVNENVLTLQPDFPVDEVSLRKVEIRSEWNERWHRCRCR